MLRISIVSECGGLINLESCTFVVMFMFSVKIIVV